MSIGLWGEKEVFNQNLPLPPSFYQTQDPPKQTKRNLIDYLFHSVYRVGSPILGKTVKEEKRRKSQWVDPEWHEYATSPYLTVT